MQPKFVEHDSFQHKRRFAMRGHPPLRDWMVLAALSLLMLPACRREVRSDPQSSIIELSDANFEHEVIASDQVVLVEFWASWCEPCLQMAPAMESIADEFSGRLKVGKLHFDDNADLAQSLTVSAPPALLVFRNGDVLKRRTGLQTQKELRDLAISVLSADSDSSLQGPE